MPWGVTGYLRFIPGLTWQCDPQIARVLDFMPPDARVVDLGAGGRRISPATICVDIARGAGTDLVADVHRLPFVDNSVDALFATGLFEHVDDPRVVVQEVVRVLRPGGVLHVEVPFLQQYHEDPIDYRRFTIPGLARELERHGLVAKESGFHIGPTVAIITLLAYYAAMWFNGRTMLQKLVSSAVFLAASVIFWPLRYLDVFAKRCRDAHRLCFGVYCTAYKPRCGMGVAK